MELKRPRKGQRGFTLIEALFSMIIFALVLAGSMGLLQWLAAATGDATRTTQASALAQSKLEEFREATYGTIGGGSDTSGVFTRVWTMNTADDGKHITVTVSWNNPTGTGSRSVVLRSYYYDD